MAARTIDLKGGYACAVASAVAVGLAFHVLPGGVGVPMHLQAVGEPGGTTIDILIDFGLVLAEAHEND